MSPPDIAQRDSEKSEKSPGEKQDPGFLYRTIDSIVGYCTRCWQKACLTPDTWDDATQETLEELLERSIPPDTWNRVFLKNTFEQKEFHRAIDATKKRIRRSPFMRFKNIDEVPPPQSPPVEVYEQDPRMKKISRALRILTKRQRQIIRLFLKGATTKEMAQKIQVSPYRIADEKYKAIRKIRTVLEEKNLLPREIE